MPAGSPRHPARSARSSSRGRRSALATSTVRRLPPRRSATAGCTPATWGYLDEEGYLYVADRRDDLIVSGGENVYPAEVESALLSFPGIEECAVVGVPDERWGALVVAVLVPGASPPDMAAVVAHLRTLLAGYKVPRRIEVTAEPLPRTASGKVQRHLVRSGLIEGARPSSPSGPALT